MDLIMKERVAMGALSTNTHLLRWIEKMTELCKPSAIHWVDGSQAEYDALCSGMVDGGTFVRLNQDLWPGCFLARSDVSDVARVEDRTFICSLSKEAEVHDQQLGRPLRNAQEAEARLRRLHARTDDVRDRVQHGTHRLADVPDRRPVDRLDLRRGEHADHSARRRRQHRDESGLPVAPTYVVLGYLRHQFFELVHKEQRLGRQRAAGRACFQHGDDFARVVVKHFGDLLWRWDVRQHGRQLRGYRTARGRFPARRA